MRQAVEQSIEIIEPAHQRARHHRAVIQRQGNDRILVQVPGLQDPNRLKAAVGQTAQLTSTWSTPAITPEQAQQGHVPPDDEILYGAERGRKPYVVEKRVLVTGEDLIDAQPGFDSAPTSRSSPSASTRRARAFGEVTQQNVGRPFAIVLDNKVISAPVIREPILGGSGQITGNFTVQSANDLAILLRAGALPAKLTIVEERTVGPGLGADSIAPARSPPSSARPRRRSSCWSPTASSACSPTSRSSINVAMIFGVLSMLGATLTLPGIAGIVLTSAWRSTPTC